MDSVEKKYKCPNAECGKEWEGIEGEIPTVCPECSTEGEIVEASADDATIIPGATGETGEASTDDTIADDVEEYEGEMGKYRITSPLVDIFDEQGIITGQFPIGSIQEVPTVVGDQWVVDGRAEKVEEEGTPAVE